MDMKLKIMGGILAKFDVNQWLITMYDDETYPACEVEAFTELNENDSDEIIAKLKHPNWSLVLGYKSDTSLLSTAFDKPTRVEADGDAIMMFKWFDEVIAYFAQKQPAH